MKFKLSLQKFFSIIIVIIVLVIIGYTAYSYTLSYAFLSAMAGPPYDHFADELVIPDDIVKNIPKGEKHQGIYYIPETMEDKDYIDIELYYGLQGGIYWYYAWLDNVETGSIYLKAYEYTKNIELSSERLLQKTEIEIDDIGENVIKIGPKEFTIYEGDWDKYYVARFELWYKPLDNRKNEIKLIEKNYLIEGWQR
jgi:hypothetical protein